MARPNKRPKTADAVKHGAQQKDRSTGPRRRLAIILIIGLTAIGVGWVLRGYMMPVSPPSVVAETAMKAPPDIAGLLYEAEDAVFEFSRQFPDTVDSLDVMATLHSRFGEMEEATNLWKRCIEKDPEFVNAHYQLGLIERSQGRNNRSSEHLRQAVKLDPESSYLVVQLAKSLVAEGKLEDAVEILEAERQAQPDSVAVLAVLGDAYLQLKQYQDSRDVYARTVELAPGLASARYGLGTSYLQLGAKEEAKEQMAKFRELKARDEQAHRDQLKNTQLGLHDVQSGVAEIETVVAKAYIAHGNPEMAEDLLQRASRLDPTSPEAPRVLAWLYEREGRLDQAVQTLTALAATLPDDFSVHLSLGQLLSRLGQVEEAEQSFRRMVELTPNDAAAHAMLAEFYLQVIAKPNAAKLAAKKAVDLAPTADHYYLLATACYHSGEMQPARVAIEQAIALVPDQPEYLRLLATIRGAKEHQ